MFGKKTQGEGHHHHRFPRRNECLIQSPTTVNGQQFSSHRDSGVGAIIRKKNEDEGKKRTQRWRKEEFMWGRILAFLALKEEVGFEMGGTIRHKKKVIK
jgi:hypothetical protein